MKQLLCVLAIVGAGCGTAGGLYRSEEYRGRPMLNASLVRDDKALLSEEAIRTLLASRIRIPERVKLAVLPLGHSGTNGEDRVGYDYRMDRVVEFPQERKAYLEALEGPLAATGRFTEITHVPALMLPQEPSLTRLREVAALMQADLLLVYSTRSHLVTWQSIWFPEKVRALASIELIVLDVRTGVVPYAETFEAQRLEREDSEDLSVVEVQRKAERSATLKAMGLAAEGLKRFLSP